MSESYPGRGVEMDVGNAHQVGRSVKMDVSSPKVGTLTYPEFIKSLEATSDQEFTFAFTDALPKDDSTIEERIVEYGKQLRLLRDEIRATGFIDEESVIALVVCFFEQEGLR